LLSARRANFRSSCPNRGFAASSRRGWAWGKHRRRFVGKTEGHLEGPQRAGESYGEQTITGLCYAFLSTMNAQLRNGIVALI
jgi:hypothetical protein